MNELTLMKCRKHILIDPIRREDGYYNVYIKYGKSIYKFIYTDYIRIKCIFGECFFYSKLSAYKDIIRLFLKIKDIKEVCKKWDDK